MNSRPYEYDFDFDYRANWHPADCDIRPWFLPDGVAPASDGGVEAVVRYRTAKLDYVRRRLAGVDREQALRDIVRRVGAGADTDLERFRRLHVFVQRMMVHPPSEQPMEANAARIIRGWKGDSVAAQAEPYPEDLDRPWVVKADAEARAFGRRLGVWCNPLGVTLDGDWGLAGMVTDALELLLLHEGRCGHQACVMVQLAQAAGLRARLVQMFRHRVAEVQVSGRWMLADPDMLRVGSAFPLVDAAGVPVSVRWCMDHAEALACVPMAGQALYSEASRRQFAETNSSFRALGYGWYFVLKHEEE